PRDPWGNEGRRGPARRQRRGGGRTDPAVSGPATDGRRVKADEDGRLPALSRNRSYKNGLTRQQKRPAFAGLLAPCGDGRPQSTRLRPWYSSSISRLSRASIF